MKGEGVNTTRRNGRDRSKELTIIICSECEKGKLCRKTYEEWEKCEDSLHYNSRKKDKKIKDLAAK